jgi:hypothetical protein
VARSAGVVLIKRMILLTNTTPASALIKASPVSGSRFAASAFPSSAEEGSLLDCDFMCKA